MSVVLQVLGAVPHTLQHCRSAKQIFYSWVAEKIWHTHHSGVKFPGGFTSTLVQSGRETSPPCKGSVTLFSPALLCLLSQALPAMEPWLGSHVTSARLLQQQSFITCLLLTVLATEKHGSEYFSPVSSLEHKDQKVRQKFCSGTGYQQVNLHSTSNSFSERVHVCLHGTPLQTHLLSRE